MTGNQIKGKGFRGALRYNLAKVEKNAAEVLASNFVRTSENSILKEVQMVRVLKPRLEKYFYHTSVNFPPGENLSNQLMKQIGQDYLQANGFTQNQFIIFRHHDADHPHLHILVNRIGFDGKVVSDSNDFQRSENVLRDLEVRYNLTKVAPSKQATERAMSKDEMEMMKRTSEPSEKIKLQVILKEILANQKKLHVSEFLSSLNKKGVNARFNQATTGYVSGISYDLNGFIITGAKLGADFKWTSIIKNLNYEQERDRATIREANIRTGQSTDQRGTDSSKNERFDRGAEKSKTRTSAASSTSQANDSAATGKSNKNPATKSTDGKSPRAIFDPHTGSSKGKEIFDLASLLTSGGFGITGNPDHQSNLAPLELRRRKKKKRRRKL